jgi:cysteine sulfinate desulfinase/cysteine desulfurase-like protein
MGLPLHDTQNALRISVGRHSTAAEITALIEALPAIVGRLRTLTDRRTPAAMSSTSLDERA